MTFHVPENLRVRTGTFSTATRDGNNGMFIVKTAKGALRVIASDGMGWEHVSVSLANRTPTWEEMCMIKGMFWSDEDCVVQFHPPASEYVNNHAHCLHLWRPIGGTFPMPDSIMVGLKGVTLNG